MKLMNMYFQYPRFRYRASLDIKILSDEFYNKINEALKYNNSLIYFGWNSLFFKEHFIDN